MPISLPLDTDLRDGQRDGTEPSPFLYYDYYYDQRSPGSRTKSRRYETDGNGLDSISTRRKTSRVRLSRGTRPLDEIDVRYLVRRRGGIRFKYVKGVVSLVNKLSKRQTRFLKSASLRRDADIRMISLYPNRLSHRQWTVAYVELREAKQHKNGIPDRALIPTIRKNDLELLELIKKDCFGTFREVWEKMPRLLKASHWQRLAFWLLLNSPELAMGFLLVTASCAVRPDFKILNGYVTLLHTYHYNTVVNWKSGTHDYASVLQICRDPENWPVLTLPQKAVRRYLNRTDYHGLVRAFRMVFNRETYLVAQTLLCFMFRFTEFGDITRALVALRFTLNLKQPGFGVNSEGVMRHCNKLLTLDSVEDNDNKGRNFRILPQLLELGVRPDQTMMNIVLSNAFRTGDPQLGLDILQYMKDQGHEFDSYTYVALLCDAVAREDRERVGELVREYNQKGDWRKDKYIASKVFHAQYVFTTKNMSPDSDPSELFYGMLDLYNELHDIAPLKELSIIPVNYNPPQEFPKSPPSLMALYIMIATYFRCQKSIPLVRQIYAGFRELVQAGHPIIAPLAESDHTYNEFLLAYRHDPRALQYCVQLVEDMLQPLKQEGGPQEGRRMIKHTKPTVLTWSILLSAFTFNKQPVAAEKVKEMMRKQNVKFNHYTWNIIVNGYANAQDVSETARSIKLMEQHGYPIDAHTLKCLRYLHDPERVWIALEDLDHKAAEEEEMKATTAAAPQEDSSQARELKTSGAAPQKRFPHACELVLD